jgi:hypothetical protein
MTSNQPNHTSRPTRRVVSLAVLSATAIAGVVGLTAFQGSAADDSRPGAPATTVDVVTATTAPRPAYLIIQDEIDRALAERRATAPNEPRGFSADTTGTSAQRPAYLIIQDEIDRALAERNSGR